jgi:hypothetical protein
MVEVAWLFNSDFEDQIFSDKKIQFNSSKQNQEFEYFISYLDPTKNIFTSKQYSGDFHQYIKSFTGVEFKCANKAKKIIPWCSDYLYKGDCLKYQSKTQFYLYMKKNAYHEHESTFIDSMDKVEAGYLYKDPHSVSGMGHYSFPKNKNVIEKKIQQNIELIKEESLNRVKDFSTLIIDNKIVAIYENIIDRNYFYSGTIFQRDEAVPQAFKSEYEAFIGKLCIDFSDYRGVMSIDSFLYLKNGEVKLFKACEVNLRKTMGYIAYSLKEKYFSSTNYFCFRIIYKKMNEGISYEIIDMEFGGRVKFLSPLVNRFQVVIFDCKSRVEYIELEKELLLKFF